MHKELSTVTLQSGRVIRNCLSSTILLVEKMHLTVSDILEWRGDIVVRKL